MTVHPQRRRVDRYARSNPTRRAARAFQKWFSAYEPEGIVQPFDWYTGRAIWQAAWNTCGALEAKPAGEEASASTRSDLLSTAFNAIWKRATLGMTRHYCRNGCGCRSVGPARILHPDEEAVTARADGLREIEIAAWVKDRVQLPSTCTSTRRTGIPDIRSTCRIPPSLHPLARQRPVIT